MDRYLREDGDLAARPEVGGDVAREEAEEAIAEPLSA